MKNLMKKSICMLLSVLMLLSGTSVLAVRFTENPMVFVIGDSQASNHFGETLTGTGWAQALHNYFQDYYMISNCAQGGASSKTFYNNYWSNVISQVQPGDYVVIQFGGNDSKTDGDTSEDLVDTVTTGRYTDPEGDKNTVGSFKYYLNKFVTEVEAKGATPILTTSVERRLEAYKDAEDSTLLYPWVTAMKEFAQEEEVAIIDLWYPVREQIVEDCPDSSVLHPWFRSYYGTDEGEAPDNTHLSRVGAMAVAKIFAQQLKESALGLKDYLKTSLDGIEYEDIPIKFVEDFENCAAGDVSAISGWKVGGTKSDKNIVIKSETLEDETTNNAIHFTANALAAGSTSSDSREQYRVEYTFPYELTNEYFHIGFRIKSCSDENGAFNLVIGGNNSNGSSNNKAYREIAHSFSENKLMGSAYTIEKDNWYELDYYINVATGKTTLYVNNTKLTENTYDNYDGSITYLYLCLQRFADGDENKVSDVAVDDVCMDVMTEDDYNEALDILPDYMSFRQNFTGATIGEDVPTSGTTWGGLLRYKSSSNSKNTDTVTFAADPADSTNTVVSLKKTAYDTSYLNGLHYTFDSALTDGVYSTKFKLLNTDSDSKVFELRVWGDSTPTTAPGISFDYSTNTIGMRYLDDTTGGNKSENFALAEGVLAKDKWLDVEVIFNLADDGKTRVTLYIGGTSIFENLALGSKGVGSGTSEKYLADGTLKEIQWILPGTSATQMTSAATVENPICAEFMLDDMSMRELFVTTESLVADASSLTGVKVNAGWMPTSAQKFIAAVYAADEDGNPTLLKGTAKATATVRGASAISLTTPLAYSEGDIVKVYFWDMNKLLPLGEIYSTKVN